MEDSIFSFQLDTVFFSPLGLIAVKNGDPLEIQNTLQLTNQQNLNWKDALEKLFDSSPNYENYESVFVSNPIQNYVFIFCRRFYDLKYPMNCCNQLANKNKEIYYFLIDDHAGFYRFIKFEEGKISRFFERDCNHNTGEFGTQLPEENLIEKENKEHSYSHAVFVLEKVINYEFIKNNIDLSQETLTLGQRHLETVEKYKEFLFILRRHKPPEHENNSGDSDFPF